MKKNRFLIPLLMATSMMAMSPMTVWAEDVATVTIGGKETAYSDIIEAFTSVYQSKTSTLKLLADVEYEYALGYGKGQNITIDLNNHTISAPRVDGGWELFKLTDDAKLTVKNGTIKSKYSGFISFDSSTLNIFNCTVVAADYEAILILGQAVVNVVDSELSSADNIGIYLASGTLNMSGNCRINGSENSYPIFIDQGTLRFDVGYMMVDQDGTQITSLSEGIGKGGDGKYLAIVADPEAAAACAEGSHTMEHHDGVTVTCTTMGKPAYWYCTTCQRYYADEDGLEILPLGIITDIAPLGHDLDADGACSRCDYVDKTPELYVLDVEEWYHLPVYGTADPVVTEDGTHVHTAEVYYYDEIDPSDIELYESSCVANFTAEVDGDDPYLLIVTLTNETGTTSIYNITINTDCVYVDGWPNGDDRGVMTVVMDGKELYAETDYFEIFVPTGGSITLTATPKREDCSFANWKAFDYDNYEVVAQSENNTFTYENITAESYLEATFSSEEYAIVEIGHAGPDRAKMTDAGGNELSNYKDLPIGTQVNFSTSLYPIPEADQGKITFAGWYKEGQGEPVSLEETFTMTAEADCFVYSQYILTLPVTNGWISYDDGYKNYKVEGGMAYTAKYVADGGDGNPAVKLTAIDDEINYKQPILIHSDQSTVTIKYSTHSAGRYNTDLVGNVGVQLESDSYADAGPLALDPAFNYFALYNKIEPVEFRPYTGGVIPRHKAVLKVSGGASSSRLSVIFDDEETTGLHTLAEDQQRKEQLLDLLGRPLSHEHRGLMVKDGKVIMQK